MLRYSNFLKSKFFPQSTYHCWFSSLTGCIANENKNKNHVTVLGIESTCDDSAAAVLRTNLENEHKNNNNNNNNNNNQYKFTHHYSRSQVFVDLSFKANDLKVSSSSLEFTSSTPHGPSVTTEQLNNLFTNKNIKNHDDQNCQDNTNNNKNQNNNQNNSTGISLSSSILSEALCSSWLKHAAIGGIHPKIACLSHQANLFQVVETAISKAALVSPSELDYIAFSYGPGLPGSLNVGLQLAIQLSTHTKIPLIPVNHIEAHILTATLTSSNVQFPYLVLLVTGGNCKIVYVESVGKYKVFGETGDDSPGEALDKIARHLRLDLSVGGSAGASLERLAQHGNPCYFDIPVPLLNQKNCNFSFSGIKTFTKTLIAKIQMEAGIDPDVFEEQESLTGRMSTGRSITKPLKKKFKNTNELHLNNNSQNIINSELFDSALKSPTAELYYNKISSKPSTTTTTTTTTTSSSSLSSFSTTTTEKPSSPIPLAHHIAASAQFSIFSHIVHRTRRALLAIPALGLPKPKCLVVCGGVASNKTLNSMLKTIATQNHLPFASPPPYFCTDNGTMIAWCATEYVRNNIANIVPWEKASTLAYNANLQFGENISETITDLDIAVPLDKYHYICQSEKSK